MNFDFVNDIFRPKVRLKVDRLEPNQTVIYIKVGGSQILFLKKTKKFEFEMNFMAIFSVGFECLKPFGISLCDAFRMPRIRFKRH